MKGSNTPPLYPREWQLRPYNGQYNAQFVIHSNSTEIGAMETDGALGPDNTWSYVCGTYDGTHDYVFLNGTVRGSNVCTTVIHDTAAQLAIGRLGSISAEYYYGTIDEVRISNTNRSSDWIWAEYMNTASNSTFNAYGTVTTNSAVNSYAVAAEKNQSWTLEPAGNWAQFKDDTNTENRTHNLFNEITAINSNSLAVVHDRTGNMTRFPLPLGEGQGEGLLCKWDAWNRLTSVTSATSAVTFSYDGDWKRLKKTVGSAVTEYYYDDMQLVEIRTNGVAREQFVYDSRYLHSVAVRDVLASDASLLTRHFLANDANFNVTVLVSTNGTVVERYTYDPYGKVTIRDSVWQPITWDASQQNIILYTGHKYDSESGLYYSLYRYYHPGFGRWATRDPLLEVKDTFTLRGISGKIFLDYYMRISGNQQFDMTVTPLIATESRNDIESVNLYTLFHNSIGKDALGLIGCCGKDVTRTLTSLDSKLTAFLTANPRVQSRACAYMWDPSWGWDIMELYQVGLATPLSSFEDTVNCPCGSVCQKTVTFKNAGMSECWKVWAMNYWLWGKMTSICGSSYRTGSWAVSLYRGISPPDPSEGETRQYGTDSRLYWTAFGYNSGRSAGTRDTGAIAATVADSYTQYTSKCSPCSTIYNGLLTVRLRVSLKYHVFIDSSGTSRISDTSDTMPVSRTFRIRGRWRSDEPTLGP